MSGWIQAAMQQNTITDFILIRAVWHWQCFLVPPNIHHLKCIKLFFANVEFFISQPQACMLYKNQLFLWCNSEGTLRCKSIGTPNLWLEIIAIIEIDSQPCYIPYKFSLIFMGMKQKKMRIDGLKKFFKSTNIPFFILEQFLNSKASNLKKLKQIRTYLYRKK